MADGFETWIGDYKLTATRPMNEAEIAFLQTRLFNRSRTFLRFILTCALVTVLCFIPVFVWSESELASAPSALWLIGVFPVSLLLLRDKRWDHRNDKIDLQHGEVDMYDLAFSDLESEDDDLEELPDSFLRTKSGRNLDLESGIILYSDVLKSPILVAKVDADLSLVRPLVPAEIEEIKRFVGTKPKFGLAIGFTIWWLIGLLSLITGNMETRDGVMWAVVSGVALVLWLLVIRGVRFRRILKGLMESSVVTRIDDNEYLGDGPDRLIWSVDRLPAPWRRSQ